jgi:hypothetical protein
VIETVEQLATSLDQWGPVIVIGITFLLLGTDLEVDPRRAGLWLLSLSGTKQLAVGAVGAIALSFLIPYYGIDDVRALAVPLTGALLLLVGWLVHSKTSIVSWIGSLDGIAQVAIASIGTVVPVVLLTSSGVDVPIPVVDAHLLAFPAVGVALLFRYVRS